MIIYNIKNELNRMYLIVSPDMDIEDDYRYKMLINNNIAGLIPLEIRNINGENKLFYDITEKENLVKYLAIQDIRMDDLKFLSEGMLRISENIKDYLLEESCVWFEPDLIFRDIKTNEFYFLCLPGQIKTEVEKREDMVSLFQMILAHLDSSDEDAIEVAYKIYGMTEKGPLLARTIFETVWEKIRTESDVSTYEPVEEEEDLYEDEYEYVPEKKKHVKMIFRGYLGMACAAAGVICIGVGTYLNFVK